MPRLARSSARCGPTPFSMRTSVERVRDIDTSFISFRWGMALVADGEKRPSLRLGWARPNWGAAVLRPYVGLRYLLVGRAY